jgi:hypothetical protein
MMVVVCSFCKAPDPVHEYPLNGPLVVPSPITAWPIDYGLRPWPACSGCARLVDADRWDALLVRVAGRSAPGERARRADLWSRLAVVLGDRHPIIRRSGALN